MAKKDKPLPLDQFTANALHGGPLANDGTTGDLTLAEFEAIQRPKYPEPKELQVSDDDKGYVRVGNDLGQMYFKLTPRETSRIISLLMEGRANAIRTRKKIGASIDE